MVPTFITLALQWQVIGRMDDMMQLLFLSLTPNI